MGLDMYLYAKKYVQDWAHNYPEGKIPETTVAKVTARMLGIPDSIPVTNVEATAIYWRKANAIHKWFVDNVQDGEDDCNEYYVSREKLQQLRTLCEKVLNDTSLAQELLPPQSGFFFGGTEIDDWYKTDLIETVEGIDRCLLLDPSFSFYYQSSW